MFPFSWSTLFPSRKGSYEPVNHSSDCESAPDRHQSGNTILKLCRQIRFISVCCTALLLLLLFPAFRDAFHTAATSCSLTQNSQFESLMSAPECTFAWDHPFMSRIRKYSHCLVPHVTKVFEEGDEIKEITAEVEESWAADMPRKSRISHRIRLQTSDSGSRRRRFHPFPHWPRE